tara:strand:- start:96 stop:314 length:219 start_codon:yes stop_codon:yes gene_type:complete
MMYERIAPDDPTKAPVITKAILPSVKPIIAAANPEYELSIEITTGISAPPIGIMSNKPNNKERIVTIKNIKE